MITSVSNH